MFKISPVQDAAAAKEYSSLCGVEYRDDAFLYAATDAESGALLFDTATYDDDVENYIMPFLSEIGITRNSLKYILVSQAHHACQDIES